MNNLDKSVLTLNRLVLLLSEEEHKSSMEDGTVRTLMDLESAYEFDGLEDYTLLQRPKYPSFAGWEH